MTLSHSFCTRCDRASESEWSNRQWRCPFCGGAFRSRNDRATVAALCRQWAALGFPEVNRKFRQYGASYVAARIGTIEDMESIATMALLRAARCFDQSRGFAFSTFATFCIRRDLHDALQLPAGYIRTRSMPTRLRDGADMDVRDDGVVEPLIDLVKREDAADVRAALQRLPARNAEALRYRFFEGMPLREVAAQMNASIQCTHCRVNKGLERLAAELGVVYVDFLAPNPHIANR